MWASRASCPRRPLGAVIAPAMFEVQTVPALAGVRFELNGQAFVSGEDGVARVPVAQAGAYRLRVLPWDNDTSGVRARIRSLGPVFAAESAPFRSPSAYG
ncbi:MAG: hypothetical protein U0Z44_07660 [Kouleothrix sp.]